MSAEKVVKSPYRHLPDPRELNARLWKDPELHTRLWTEPLVRDAYVKVIDKALIDAITGKEPMERVADVLSDVVMTQVQGELMILGLWDHFFECGPPIKFILYGLIIARMVSMKKRAESADDDTDPI